LTVEVLVVSVALLNATFKNNTTKRLKLMKLFIQSVGKGADYRDEVTRTISDVGAERFVNQLAAKGNAKAKIM